MTNPSITSAANPRVQAAAAAAEPRRPGVARFDPRRRPSGDRSGARRPVPRSSRPSSIIDAATADLAALVDRLGGSGADVVRRRRARPGSALLRRPLRGRRRGRPRARARARSALARRRAAPDGARERREARQPRRGAADRRRRRRRRAHRGRPPDRHVQPERHPGDCRHRLQRSGRQRDVRRRRWPGCERPGCASWPPGSTARTTYAGVDLRGPVAIVLGSEADGLSEAWRGTDISASRLPMLGVGRQPQRVDRRGGPPVRGPPPARVARRA